MRNQSQSHRHPSQTTPDIFAAHTFFKPKTHVGPGSFHQWGLNLTLRGHCHWRNEEEEMNVAAGDLLLNRPHTWMSWRVAGAETRGGGTEPGDNEAGWDTVYVHFHPRPHWGEWLDALEYRHGFARLHFADKARRELARDLRTMVRAYESGGLLRDERTLVALESVLLTVHSHTARSRLKLDPRVTDAMELMHARYAEPLTIPEIAQAVGLSESHFAHLFSAALGETPGECLERVRLTRATEMLRFSTQKVADIARVCGLRDPSYFALRFRIHFGQSPSAYRAASRP